MVTPLQKVSPRCLDMTPVDVGYEHPSYIRGLLLPFFQTLTGLSRGAGYGFGCFVRSVVGSAFGLVSFTEDTPGCWIVATEMPAQPQSPPSCVRSLTLPLILTDGDHAMPVCVEREMGMAAEPLNHPVIAPPSPCPIVGCTQNNRLAPCACHGDTDYFGALG